MSGRATNLLRSLAVAAVAAISLWLSASAGAQPALPISDRDAHMGVATCSGSTCHGAVAAMPGIGIMQNEFVTWQRRDKHAEAYKVLLNERSKRIARNLGLENAHTAPICLDCHADNVASNRRHTTFQISDGVTCEACHGGAGRWIGTHITAGATHANNIQNGMYPTDDPVSRARLCISCHFGDQTRLVTHRIMGAGHPRMSFELDTFTALQPAHFEVDADYRSRKRSYSGVQTWAIGQAIALDSMLAVATDPQKSRDGIFPELVLFDCHSCHSPMSQLNWAPRASTGLGPGIPKFNDSNSLMLGIIAARVDPALGTQFRERMLALHRATVQSHDAMQNEAKALRPVLQQLIQKFASHSFAAADLIALVEGVLTDGMAGNYVEYAGAEQATMALGTILNSMRQTGAVDQAKFQAMNRALDKVFSAVDNDEKYAPETFAAALRDFQTAAR